MQIFGLNLPKSRSKCGNYGWILIYIFGESVAFITSVYTKLTFSKFWGQIFFIEFFAESDKNVADGQHLFGTFKLSVAFTTAILVKLTIGQGN